MAETIVHGTARAVASRRIKALSSTPALCVGPRWEPKPRITPARGTMARARSADAINIERAALLARGEDVMP